MAFPYINIRKTYGMSWKMGGSPVNLKEQQYIVALANYGNMTQAAKYLGVT